MRLFYHLFLGIFFVLSYSSAIYAEEFLDLNKLGDEPVFLPEYTKVLEDKERKLTIEDIAKPENQEKFLKAKSSKEGFNFSYSDSAFWFRVAVKNSNKESLGVKFQILYPLLESVQFYYPKDNTYKLISAGYRVPYEDLVHKNRYNTFPYKIPPLTEGYIYFRVHSINSINVPLLVLNDEAFFLYERNDYVQQALFFGLLLGMLIFNILLYSILKEFSYLLYVLEISFTGLAFLGYSGIGHELIWRNFPTITQYATNIFVTFSLIFICLFAQKILRSKIILPTFDKLLNSGIILMLAINLGFLIYFKFFVRIIVLSYVVLCFLLLILGIVSVTKKQRNAYFFLIAFVILLLSLIVTSLRALGILPATMVTLISPQIGASLKMMLLAFALADNYNTMRKAKESAEAQIKENLEKSNFELETKVKERTLALNNTLEIIREDLIMAQKIQKNSLNLLPNIQKELTFKIHYSPMSEVGGDYYSIYKLNDTSYRIFLADATGHGVQGAMITMVIKGIFDNIKNSEHSISEIMSMFNDEYILKYSSLQSYLTAILIDINTETKTLRYVSAGHPPTILIQNSNLLQLENTGKIVGVVNGSQYREKEFEFKADDKVLIFTDGVFEEFNEADEEFGIKRLVNVISENKNLNVEKIIDQILSELDLFLQSQPKQDDISLIGIEYTST